MLGTLVPVMAGVAMAARMQKKKNVALTYIGDGGTSTVPFHEGLNFAAVQRLPLIVIAENNGWAYSTPFRKQTAAKCLADRAAGYGIPGESVDGNDVLAIYEATRRAVARARVGGGPTLIESRTYRMKGHAEHDGQTYVPNSELMEWTRRDPIDRYVRTLEETAVATAEEIAAIDRDITHGLEADLAYAESCPMPSPESALDGVYAPAAAASDPVMIRKRS